jgi:hypothetical protein
MKILATINVGQQIMTQLWDFTAGDAECHPHLGIMRLADGGWVRLPLDRNRVQTLPGSNVSDKVYTGMLDITNAVVIEAPSSVK